MAPVNIGENGYSQNQFLNITYGIISQNSRVVVKNALFQESTIDPVTTNGILVTGGTMNVSASTFNNCFYGIQSTSCHLKIVDNNFSSNRFCIDLSNSSGKNISIIENEMTETLLYGVQSRYNGVFNSFLVEGNYIEMDNPSSSQTPFSAVEISSPSLVTQSNLQVNDNYIEMYGSANGINISSNRNSKVQENLVEITHATGLSPAQEHGIRLNNSGNSSIVDNSVIVVYSAGGASTIHTIELNDSENVLVCGNTAEDADSGFKFNGQNPSTTFSNNIISDNKVGLHIEEGGYMGVQARGEQARDNLWTGSYSQWGAQNANSDQGLINLSLFYVRNNSQPQMPPSISTTGWFYSTGTGLNLSCPIEGVPDDPTEYEKKVALGTLPFSEYVTARLWRAQTMLYRSLKEYPELLGEDEDVDAFYSSAASGIIGDFYEIAEGISSLGIPDGETAQEYASLEEDIVSKMSDLEDVDVQLLSAEGGTYAALVAQRLSLSEDINELHIELMELDADILAERITTANQLISLNAAITTTTLPQEYLQAVNDIYLNTVGIGVLELTTGQIDILEPIANTCIHEGGDAVLGARLLFELTGTTTEYDDELLCSPPPPRIQVENGNSKVLSKGLELSPNPAKGEVMIKFPIAEEERTLEVFDQNGMRMYSASIREGHGSHLLSLNNLPTGINMVSMKSNKQVLTQKLVVLP